MLHMRRMREEGSLLGSQNKQRSSLLKNDTAGTTSRPTPTFPANRLATLDLTPPFSSILKFLLKNPLLVGVRAECLRDNNYKHRVSYHQQPGASPPQYPSLLIVSPSCIIHSHGNPEMECFALS